MASGIAVPLANVLLGLSSIGASIGFTIRENELMDELKRKTEKLQKDISEAGDLYDNVYYAVAVNLERLRRAFDSLPSDFIEKAQEDVDPQLKSQNSITVVGLVLGHGARAFGTFAGTNRFMGGLVELVKYLRNKPPGISQGRETNIWGDVRMRNLAEPEELEPFLEPTTVSRTPKFDKIMKGVNIARLVFGVAGLSAIVGIGIWTVDRLEEAIADVDDKQQQVSAFQKAMEMVLDELVREAALPAKNGYDELKKPAEAWKELCQLLESYKTRMYYAIQGYFMYKSLDGVKEIVEKHTDPSDKPFPVQCYNLAKTLADDIRLQFDKNKTDKEIVNFFATENPVLSLKVVLSEFFIGTLRGN